MKPIEPGCMALVVSKTAPEIPIHTVTVKRRVNGCGWCSSCGSIDKWWRVDTSVCPAGANACECCLRRIDGGDPDAVLEVDKEVVA